MHKWHSLLFAVSYPQKVYKSVQKCTKVYLSVGVDSVIIRVKNYMKPPGRNVLVAFSFDYKNLRHQQSCSGDMEYGCQILITPWGGSIGAAYGVRPERGRDHADRKARSIRK